MPIYHGSTKIGSIYKGSTKIGQVYHGSTLVYSGKSWQTWQSPDMTSNGTFGGADYGATQTGRSDYMSRYHAYLTWRYIAPEDTVNLNIPNCVANDVPYTNTFYSPNPIKITQVYIRWWSDLVGRITVGASLEISMDNNNWTTIVTKPSGENWTSARTITVNSNQECKYVRINATYSAKSSFLSGGIKLYGQIYK